MINIDDLQFHVLVNRSAGCAKIKYTLYENRRSDGEAFTAVLPLVSLWIDPLSAKQIAMRAFMRANKAVAKHRDLIEAIANEKFIGDDNNRRIGFSVEPRTGLIRYGAGSRYTYRGYDTATYDNYDGYETKAHAISEVISSASEYFQIGGLDFVNLQSVNDAVLQESGFEIARDVLGKGAPMWVGSAAKVIYHGSSYGSSRMTGTENATSFINLLSSSLGGCGVTG